MAKLKLHTHEFSGVSPKLVTTILAGKLKEMKKAASRLPTRKSGRAKSTLSSSSKTSSGSLKRTGLRVPRVSLRGVAKRVVRKISSVNALKQRGASSATASRIERGKAARASRNGSRKSSKSKNYGNNTEIVGDKKLVKKKPRLNVETELGNDSNLTRRDTGNLSSSLLSPNSTNISPTISPTLVDARSNALSQIEELQRSLRQKEEQTVLSMRLEVKEGTIEANGDKKADASHVKHPHNHTTEAVHVIDDIFLDDSGKVDSTPHKISAATIDEDFITKTLLDPDLKLSSTIGKTPRALITALTSRLKSIEANTNSRVNLKEAFASTAPNGTARNEAETIKYLTVQLDDAKMALEQRKQQIDKLMQEQATNQSMVESQNNTNLEKDLQLFDLRAEVSELRVQLRAVKKESENAAIDAKRIVEETEKRTQDSILKSAETHKMLVDRTLKKHEEKHDELELLKVKHKAEIDSLKSELNTTQQLAKESSSTLRRHLDLALSTDEELRATHAEAKTLKEEVLQLQNRLSIAEKHRRKAENEVMVALAELAALREDAVVNREKHIEKMLSSIKMENSSLKQKCDELQNEKDIVEEREMRLQDHCESLQEEVAGYKERFAILGTDLEALRNSRKKLMIENRRMKYENKTSKKIRKGEYGILSNLKHLSNRGISLDRGLYSFPESRDSKLVVDSMENKVDNGSSTYQSKPFGKNASIRKKNYSAAQKAAESIQYPKLKVKASETRNSKQNVAWRPGGNAKAKANKNTSKQKLSSPPQFNKEAYKSLSLYYIDSDSNVQKPWEPRVSGKPRRAEISKLESDTSKSAADDASFALADIVDINTAWDNGTNDFRENASTERNEKLEAFPSGENAQRRQSLNELAEVLESLRDDPTSVE